MLTTGEHGPRLKIMADPEKHLTPELRKKTLEKLKTLRAPVLTLHGDRHDSHKLNAPLFVPMMKKAGVRVKYCEYPRYGHGFYFGGGDYKWGKSADEKIVGDIVRENGSFLKKEMPSDGVKEKPHADSKSDRSLWVSPAMRANRVEQRTFESAAAKTKVSYHIYTPEIYDKDKDRRFPVLYWLHGSGGGLAGIKPLSEFFDEAIRKEKIPPMLIVFPNGMASSMWCDSKEGKVPMEQVFIKELLPKVDRDFRTIAKREGRLIEGFSMGGYGAARLGFKNPELFGAVSILAGGPLDLDFQGPRAVGNPTERQRILNETFGGDLDDYKAKSPLTIVEGKAKDLRGQSRVRVVVGTRDFTAELNRAFSSHLKKHEIEHEFKLVPEIGHDTMALLKGLGEVNWDFYKSSLLKETK
jgi:enterochelin esterase-like enzyme